MTARSILTLLTAALVGTVCAAAAAPTPAARTPLSVRQVSEMDMPSVVMIVVSDKRGEFALGSGFVVAPNVVATNIHVIAGAAAVSVSFPDGHKVASSGAVAADRDHDLVLIQADTGSLRPLPLASVDDTYVGDTVVALGHPEGLGWSVSAGVVSAIRSEDNLRVMQTTTPISHGSSGGPLLDLFGDVVGVNSFNWGAGQNLNFAYPESYLEPLLQHRAAHVSPWSDFPAPPPDTSSDAPQKPAAPAEATRPSGTPSAAPSAPPGGSRDMVWVNMPTHVYHRSGSRYYGKTKKGQYMTEADAIAHGCHAASNGQ